MKTIIIFGGTSGIGAALAIEFLEAGNQVVALGLKAHGENILNQKNNHLIVDYFDSISGNNHDKLKELTEKYPEIDKIIFCAGIGNLSQDTTFEKQNYANQLNVLAFTTIADCSLRYFKRKKSGHFIAISSISGIRGSSVAPAYHAAKSYQINYLESLRQQVADSNIHITDVRPGFVDTQLAKGKPTFWMCRKKKAAKQIYQAIQSKVEVVYISKRWRMIAWFMKMAPNKLLRILYEK